MAQREKNLGCVQSESSIMFGLNLCDQNLNNRKKFPADCLNMVEHLQKKKYYLSLIFGFSLKKVMVIYVPNAESKGFNMQISLQTSKDPSGKRETGRNYC